ncbi:MAG: hypothetical protein IPK52_11970 [Chloroflexi bacterium]|nr:hypothetical protein [Chloroflexota bacterium]
MTFAKPVCILLCAAALALSACEPGAVPVIPTERPTASPTIESTASVTPDASPTQAETPTPAITGGPTPTSLLGPTRTPDTTAQFQATRPANPNAPYIEFFRASPATANPGGSFDLFWSSRNVPQAVIYRLDAAGQRTLVYNVEPFGRQTITLSARERVQVEYELIIGEGAGEVSQRLVIPLACPIAWFFSPVPDSCPISDADPTAIVEQAFERGRMIYVASEGRIYVLYNDGRTPAWASYQDVYRPGVDPERDENFDRALAGTTFVQPVGRLGFLWRGLDNVRNRLGNGTAPELSFEGFFQEAPTRDTANAGRNDLYITSSEGTVIQLLPSGSQWQILTPSDGP